jgi:type VI secretion system protein VasD
MWKRGMARWCCAVVALCLAACGSSPPKPVATKLAIGASTDVNPDSDGRASPVVVRFYQLRTEGEFTDARFFPLYDHEKDVLGQGLISRDEFTLSPGGHLEQALPVSPEARYFGVLVAFREQTAEWHAVVPITPKSIKRILKDQTVDVRLNKAAVTISVNGN